MQVQRGLGASKLAISSVGGTINVITKSTDLTEGGRVSASVGNDGYGKTVASYNTVKWMVVMPYRFCSQELLEMVM